MRHACLGIVVAAFHRALRTGSLFVLVLVALTNSSFCQNQTLTTLTTSEQLILHRLIEKGEADLSDAAFGGRKISTDLINKLLSGGLKSMDPAGNMNVYGIVISHAVFEDQVTIGFEVPYRVQFNSCRFKAGIDFSGSQFNKDLVFNSDVFGPSPEDLAMAITPDNSNPEVEFTNAVVNGTLSFQKSFFYAPLDFTKAHVKELDITDAIYGWEGGDPEIDLTATHVDSDLNLSIAEGQRQPHKVHAQFLNAGGSTSLGDDKVGFFAIHDFDLTYSHFQNLVIYRLSHWLDRAHKDSASLDGFSFQEISFPVVRDQNSNKEPDCHGEDPSPSTLLCLLDSPATQYSTAPYLQLEQNLNASGHAGRANRAYIHMRNRQRGHRFYQPVNQLAALISWLADWFLYIATAYGRWPWLTGIWAGLFVGLGMWVFHPDCMQPQSESGAKNNSANVVKENGYSRFWYSLDVLAPAIELGVDKSYEPKPDPQFHWVRTYAYFHRIAGWILVPLVVAAIGGIIH
jgi:hypothetical protein